MAAFRRTSVLFSIAGFFCLVGIQSGLAYFEGAGRLDDRPRRKIGELELSLVGISATVDPLNLVVPKNVASGVRIVFRGGAADLSLDQVKQFLGPRFEVRAELTGPGLRDVVEVSKGSDEADPLLLPVPSLSVSGDYELSNIRILVAGKPALDVSPSRVPVQVIEQILVTSVETRPLTLDEIRAKGIVLDSDDYLAFEFTVGLILESKLVRFDFNAVFDSRGLPLALPIEPPPSPVRSPIRLDDVLPAFYPLLLEVEDGDGELDLPKIELPGGGKGDIRIPSVLVIPGNVGFLKQFFSAQLFIANGAPVGTPLVVKNVTGKIHLPPGADHDVTKTDDNPLSLPDTVNGPAKELLDVRGVGPDGLPNTADDQDLLRPGEQGQAEFLLRGDLEGFHEISFDIRAVLDGLPTGPVNICGKARGGVLVRNPFFDVTFTIPSVVRANEKFKLFVTVNNIGESDANDVSVSFDSGLAGVRLAPNEPGTKRVDTVKKKSSRTLPFTFVSERTGQVVASYIKTEGAGAGSGAIHFTLGVGERGVPLSPDTLVLPSPVENLSPDLVSAAMRVLGQAWSIANAPTGTLPSDVKRTSKRVVTKKALALAEAGLRVSLAPSDPEGAKRAAVRDLGFDFYGGSPLDAGFDQLLRTTEAGWAFARELGAELVPAMNEEGGILPYERDSAQVAASGPDFITFAAGGAPVEVTLSDGAGRTTESWRPSLPVDSPPRSEIPGTVLIPLGPPGSAPLLGILTAPAASPFTIEIDGRETGAADLSLTFPRGDGSFVRGFTTGLPVSSGSRARVVVDLARPDGVILEEDKGNGFEPSLGNELAFESIAAQGPRLLSATVIGPDLLNSASPMGVHAVLVFDRVIDPESLATARYIIPDNSILWAQPKLSGRLVFAALSQPEGPYVLATVDASGFADSRGTVGPPVLGFPLRAVLEDPGAVVTGRVFNADGTPVTRGELLYANFTTDIPCVIAAPIGVSKVPLVNEGRFEFRYVRQNPCGQPFSIRSVDPDSGAIQIVSRYVRTPGELINIDIALFGRGSVTGLVIDLSGKAVPGANVTVLSVTDPQSGGVAVTDGQGRYTVHGIIVGPVSVRAGKDQSLGKNSGRIFRAGTTATVDVLLDGGTVAAKGFVYRVEKGEQTAIPGIQVVYGFVPNAFTNPIPVGVAITNEKGLYEINKMPTGDYLIEAILNTRDRGFVTGNAGAGETIEKDIFIEIPDVNLGRVKGTVYLPGPDREPARDVIVSVEGSSVLTRPDGSYEIPNVDLRSGLKKTVSAQTRDRRRSGSRTVDFATKPDLVIEGADIVLSSRGNAKFTVRDADGNLARGLHVRTNFTGASPCGRDQAVTGADGVATFQDLAAGGVSALAVKSSLEWAFGSAFIPSEGATGEGELKLNGVGSVTGTVLLPDGRPAHGARVSLSSGFLDTSDCTPKSTITHQTRTGEDGKFRLSKVGAGVIQISASHEFFPTNVGENTVLEHKKTRDFTLRLVDTIAGKLTGTVYLPDGVNPAGAGVEVTARGSLPDVTVRTDEAGKYGFARILPQGYYTLTLRDPVTGFVAQERIFLRTTDDVVHDLRLKGRGTVRVKVVDGADVPVPNAFVVLKETDYPARTFEGVIEAANEGVLSFTNVFEGAFSVEVSDPLGRGGRLSSVLPKPDDTVEVKVRLTTTGRVEGRFLMPDVDKTPIPFGIVKLIAGGRTIGQTTTEGPGGNVGDLGAYSFDFVPAGPVRIEAADPATARTGVNVGTLELEDQVLTIDVTAQGLGTVTGRVLSNGQPQGGAHVDLVSGSFKACTFASTSGQELGEYIFEGVPEGRVVVTASLGASGFLSGTNSGTLSGEGTTLNLDVSLRDSERVEGQVVSAEGPNVQPPATLVTIQVGGTGGGTESTSANLADGSFAFEQVPVGLATITADVVGSIDKGQVKVEVPTEGKVLIPLNGVGKIDVRAGEENDPEVARDLFIKGTGDFPYDFSIRLGKDGIAFLPEVLAGPVTATLRATRASSVPLYGTASGNVVQNQTLSLPVALEDSGTVTGVVLRSQDPRTPAVGAEVSIQLSKGGTVKALARAGGRFTAPGVPVGTATLRVDDPLTKGVAFRDSLVVTKGEPPLDLGDILLVTDPFTVTVSPAEGATEVPLDQEIRVSFSERLQPSTISGVSVKELPALTRTLSPDGRTVTLNGALPESTLLTVNVSTSVTDVLGRRLVQPFTSRFKTVGPPQVASITPANGQTEVLVNTTIEVTFDEPLDGNRTDLSSLIVVRGQPANFLVDGETKLESPTKANFTPRALLAENTTYSVTVVGAVDLTGRRQQKVFTSSFATTDTIPPVLTLLSPPPAGWAAQRRPKIRIAMADNLTGVNLNTIALAIDGQAVVPAKKNPLEFTPAVDLAEGEHEVSLSVRDNAGNLGTLTDPTTGAAPRFRIDTVPPTEARVVGVSVGQVIRGKVAGIGAEAQDTPSGVAFIDLFTDGASPLRLTPPSFLAAIYDTTTLAEGEHVFTAQAFDFAENRGPLGPPVRVIVDNKRVIVTIKEPPKDGSRFGASVFTRAEVSEPVTNVRFEVGPVRVDDSEAPYEATLDLSPSEEGSTSIEVTATELSGETGRATRHIIVDRTPPAVSAVEPVNGAENVPINQGIILRFAEPLEPTSVVPGTVRLFSVENDQRTDLEGTVTLSNDRTSVSFFPKALLKTLTVHETEATSLCDVAGNCMTAVFRTSFKTSNVKDVFPPKVLRTSPPHGQTDVPTNVPFEIEFDDRMDPATLTAANVSVKETTPVERPVAGTIQVDPDGRGASFVPDSQWSVGRTHSVSLLTKITDAAGNALNCSAGPCSFGFVTAFEDDLDIPSLLGTSPKEGATDVPTNVRVSLAFSEPVDTTSVHRGVELLAGAVRVAVSIALSNANRRVVLTPASDLGANTPYTLAVSDEVTDFAGFPLANPGAFTFLTGANRDITSPSIKEVNPPTGSTGVPTNAVVEIQFSERVDPLSGSSAKFFVEEADPSVPLDGRVEVSEDGLTARFVLTKPLTPSLRYRVNVSSAAFTDLAGNALGGLTTTFTTGVGGEDRESPVVQVVSPPSGATGVPTNAKVSVRMSEPVNRVRLGAESVVLSVDGARVAGTLTVSGGGSVVTFVPSSGLQASKEYRLEVRGIDDVAGNRMVGEFTSVFTTGVAADVTPPSVTFDPVNGSTNVPLEKVIRVTFSEPVNPGTVNGSTVKLTLSGAELLTSVTLDGVVASVVAVEGLLPNRTYGITLDHVEDYAGKETGFRSVSFTTVATGGGDTTPPEVLLVTPVDGAVDVHPETIVVLTFSEALEAGTINTDKTFFGLFGNGAALAISTVSRTSDQRTVILTPSSALPGNTEITVVATSDVKDLSGNRLRDFRSAFRTASGDRARPKIATQRPGKGASGVSRDKSVVLYASEPLKASTVEGALFISQNGVRVSGGTAVRDGGRTIEFTPSSPWDYGSLIQIFMTSAAEDLAGNHLTEYDGSFRTVADPSQKAPTVVRASLVSSATVVRNVVIEVELDEELDETTVNVQTVLLRRYVGGVLPEVPRRVSLVREGRVIRIESAALLEADSLFFYDVTTGVKDRDGVSLANLFQRSFRTNQSEDRVGPKVVSVSPPSGAVDVGVNGEVRVRFDEAVNELSVTGETVLVSGGGAPVVPCTIVFASGSREVQIVPHGPLAASTVYRVRVEGVEDIAGNLVEVVETVFTTASGPDTEGPVEVRWSPSSSATNVPVNSVVTMEFNEALDPASVDSESFRVRDQFLVTTVAGDYFVSGRLVSFVPKSPLAVGRNHEVFVNYFGLLRDLTGNAGRQNSLAFTFTTSFASDEEGPKVTGSSPRDGWTKVPINARVVVEFDEPIQTSLTGVVLSAGGEEVEVLRTGGPRTAIVIPVVPLQQLTEHVVRIEGVKDLSGNLQEPASEVRFTTGAGADFVDPIVTTVNPANGSTGVPANVVVEIQFSERVDPLSGSSAKFFVEEADPSVPLDGRVEVSEDGLTARFVLTKPLTPSLRYRVNVSSAAFTDLAGNALGGLTTTFTTGVGGEDRESPVVQVVSPPSGATGVPTNAKVSVRMSEPVNRVRLGAESVVLSVDGARVAGTLTVSGGGSVVTFVPSSGLQASKEYRLEVRGIDDVAGNRMVGEFTSVFTTGVAADVTPPSVTFDPVNGSTNVPLEKVIRVTFSEPVNPGTVNGSTVKLTLSGAELLTSVTLDGVVASVVAVEGLLPNRTYGITLDHVEDYAGKETGFRSVSFTTVATGGGDTTPPEVLLVTPVDGAVDVHPETIVVLTFSEALEAGTINTDKTFFGLFGNGAALAISTVSRTSDQRTVILTPSSALPGNTEITVVATSDVKDLSGNRLRDFRSAFRTASGDRARPKIATQRPGKGASGVSRDKSVVLYASEPLKASTVEGALFISQNGVRVSGGTAVRDGGRTIEFTPSSPWDYGSLIQIFMTSAAEDLAGNHLTEYDGSFRTVADPSQKAPTVVRASLVSSATVVRNVVIEVELDEELDETTVNVQTVLLRRYVGGVLPEVPRRVSLVREGRVIRIESAALLEADSLFFYDVTTGVKDRDGVSLANLFQRSFRTNQSEDRVGPKVVSVSPPSGAVDVGVNGEVRVRFDEAVNELSVTGETVLVSGGGAPVVPCTIVFASGSREVQIVPHGPLAASTVYRVRVEGVEDIAGNLVEVVETVFTTASGPDTEGPVEVRWSPSSSATNVPVNSVVTMEFNEALDPASVDSESFRVRDQFLVTTVAGDYFVSGRLVSFVPKSPLAVGRNHEVFVNYFGLLRDLTGNAGRQNSLAFTFTTSFASDEEGPKVTGSSPRDGWTKVPINARVVVEFDEPIQTSLTGVVLSAGGEEVEVLRTGGPRTAIVIPVVPLQQLTEHVVRIEGVKDLSGNLQEPASEVRFTTGAGADFVDPIVTTVNPANGSTGVPANTVVEIQFSERVDPTTVTTSTLFVETASGSVKVAGALEVAQDGLTARFLPDRPLLPSTRYQVRVTVGVTDLVGKTLVSFASLFTTGTQ